MEWLLLLVQQPKFFWGEETFFLHEGFGDITYSVKIILMSISLISYLFSADHIEEEQFNQLFSVDVF